MKGPRIAGPPLTLKLLVGTTLFDLNCPSNTQESAIDATCFSAGPCAHKKRIDFGGFFTCSVRSAITRNASAVTFTSASCRLSPYTMTPGNSGIDAIQRPSSSRSNSILKDSPPSGVRGTVATDATPTLPASGEGSPKLDGKWI